MGTGETLVGHGVSAFLAETFTTGTLVGKPGTIVGRPFSAIIGYYAEMTLHDATVPKSWAPMLADQEFMFTLGTEIVKRGQVVRPFGSRLTGLRSRCPLARGRIENKLLL